MSSHVPQKSLLLLTAFPDRGAFLNTELAEPQQDLEKRLALELRFRVLFQSMPGGSQRAATVKKRICMDQSSPRQQNQVLGS